MSFEISHEQTRTSKKALIIEKALAKVYRDIFKSISSEKQYPYDMGAIKTKYKKTVYGQTRVAVQDAYEAAARYSEDATNEVVFFSAQDERIVSGLTDRTVERFWIRVERIANDDLKEIHKQELEAEAEPSTNDPDYSMNVTATNMATAVLMLTTMAKTKEVTDANPEIDTSNWRWVWVARMDAVTCKELPNGNPGCWYLHGTEWEYDEFDQIPVPGELGPDGTHPNCHCRVLLKKGDSVVVE